MNSHSVGVESQGRRDTILQHFEPGRHGTSPNSSFGNSFVVFAEWKLKSQTPRQAKSERHDCDLPQESGLLGPLLDGRQDSANVAHR